MSIFHIESDTEVSFRKKICFTSEPINHKVQVVRNALEVNVSPSQLKISTKCVKLISRNILYTYGTYSAKRQISIVLLSNSVQLFQIERDNGSLYLRHLFLLGYLMEHKYTPNNNYADYRRTQNRIQESLFSAIFQSFKVNI